LIKGSSQCEVSSKDWAEKIDPRGLCLWPITHKDISPTAAWDRSPISWGAPCWFQFLATQHETLQNNNDDDWPGPGHYFPVKYLGALRISWLLNDRAQHLSASFLSPNSLLLFSGCCGFNGFRGFGDPSKRPHVVTTPGQKRNKWPGMGEKPFVRSLVRFIHENPRLIRAEMCEQHRWKATTKQPRLLINVWTQRRPLHPPRYPPPRNPVAMPLCRSGWVSLRLTGAQLEPPADSSPVLLTRTRARRKCQIAFSAKCDLV